MLAVKKELSEIKLYCPLTFRVEPDDPCDNLDEVDSANYIGYDHEINAAVRADLYSDEGAVKRGLAAYFHDDNLDKKCTLPCRKWKLEIGISMELSL